MEQLRRLCREMTDLSEGDIRNLEQLNDHIQLMADLYGCDVFIDCLVRGRSDQAIVVAEAKPRTTKSLYSESLIGLRILRDNEPGVFYTFSTGKYITGTRAITDEKVTVVQKVLPIKNGNRVIAVLIAELIPQPSIQEQNMQWFHETTEQPSVREMAHPVETLWEVAVAETNLPTLIQEGIILYNAEGLLTYANPTARRILEKWIDPTPKIGTPLSVNPSFHTLIEQARHLGVESEEVRFGNHVVLVKAISIRKNNRYKGGMFLLRDVTELREKEKQLVIKSAVIKEIHHRVKNNLQSISSLLRLQMRRIKDKKSRKAFQDSISRISSIALVHETLSHDGIDHVELHKLVERMVSMMVNTMSDPEKKITYRLDVEPTVLPSGKATAVALILNELVQNCLDHAFGERESGQIEVQMKHEGSNLVMTVRDNGHGFDPAQVSKQTLGTRIVKALVEQELEGKLQYRHQQGTEVTFSFPVS
jgi:two-component sensor histidine kinase